MFPYISSSDCNMYSFQYPLFTRKVSLGSLIDLSEKCEGPRWTEQVRSINEPAEKYDYQPEQPKTRPRVAIIGAGITGVSTACQILDSGVDCHIFEAGTADSVGGIWTRVNDTSSLQIHSQFYSFHPSVEWQSDYPSRGEILGQVYKLWHNYQLQERATFNFKVESVYREGGKWVINDRSNGYFDGVVAAVGTCGKSYAPGIEGQESFQGTILHSSQLHGSNMAGKNVVIVGGGASAVEAMEYACDNGAASVKVLARSERWFIPRKPVLNMCLAGTIGDRYGLLARILEFLIRLLVYREFWDMAPGGSSSTGIFSGTPIVNSRVFELMRKGRAKWIRADIHRFTSQGIRISRRARGTESGDEGTISIESADVCVLATGYRRPSIDFLPADDAKSNSRYKPPNWYLQVFPTSDATLCATNCTWKDGIGSVGGCHIGIYTRFLLVFLTDPLARPTTRMMQAWVDLVHILKKPAAGGALAFVTSAELFLWFLVMILVQPSMWKWGRFVLLGNGSIPGGPELKGGVRKEMSPEFQPVRY